MNHHLRRAFHGSLLMPINGGIALNIDCEDGKEILKRLVERADFVIESFSLGYLESLDLGYKTLSKINPRIILTSISAFGKDGPYSDYLVTNIVGMARDGSMYIILMERDKAPPHFSFPLACLHAASEAAVGTMIAHYTREMTGEGQIVDQSMQQSVIGTLHNTFQTAEMTGKNIVRSGTWYRLRPPPATGVRAIWPCKDGFASFILLAAELGARINIPLIQWMDAEGMCPAPLKEINWKVLDMMDIPPDILQTAKMRYQNFFMEHTKSELYQGAIKWRTLVYPQNDCYYRQVCVF